MDMRGLLAIPLALALSSAVAGEEDWRVEHAEYPPAHVDMSDAKAVREMYRDILEKMSDFALVPPRILQENLGRYAYTNLDYAMNGTIEIAKGGRLRAGWISGEDGPRGFFVSNYSDDRGETWSDPVAVVDAHDPRLAMARVTLCGNYWTDPQGRLHLFADQSMGMYAIPGIVGCTSTDGRRGFWEFVCDDPQSDRPTWSAPRRLSDGHALNKPIVLANGDWLLPVARGVHGGQPFEPAGVFREVWQKVWGAWWLGSSDGGRTWKMRGGVRFPDSQWFEQMAYQTRSGRVRMFARTRKGIMESWSDDNGYTWSKPAYPKGIRHPLSRFFVRRLAGGALLFVKHGEKIDEDNVGSKPFGSRSKLTAWISDDDGETWIGGLMLEPLECSYPDGVQGPDGTIYVTYDHQRDRAAEIRMARFSEADVRAGRLVSPGSKLGLLVMKGLKTRSRQK